MSPLVTYPEAHLLLPPRLFGSVGYYALMAQYGKVSVDIGMRYDKRAKAVHRYDIVDTRGPVALTVPLAKPHIQGPATWADATVSTHDEWWHTHRVTLESAYGRTPYFEFVYDRFAGVISDPSRLDPWPTAISLAHMADRQVRDFLGFDNQVEWCAVDSAQHDIIDLRRISSFAYEGMPRYRQIRESRLGFRPNLSILDLIFNLGPEAVLYLRDFGRVIQSYHAKHPQ